MPHGSSFSGTWLKRSNVEILCLLSLPLITFLVTLCPQDLFSPVVKRVLTQTGPLHTGIVCWGWVTFGRAEFKHKIVLLPWLLLPWLLDAPQHWSVLFSAMCIAVLQERLAHWLSTRAWLFAFIHLDLIWMAYRPLFFPKLADWPLFFGSTLSEDDVDSWELGLCAMVSIVLIALPFVVDRGWHHHRRSHQSEVSKRRIL